MYYIHFLRNSRAYKIEIYRTKAEDKEEQQKNNKRIQKFMYFT